VSVFILLLHPPKRFRFFLPLLLAYEPLCSLCHTTPTNTEQLCLQFFARLATATGRLFGLKMALSVLPSQELQTSNEPAKS